MDNKREADFGDAQNNLCKRQRLKGAERNGDERRAVNRSSSSNECCRSRGRAAVHILAIRFWVGEDNAWANPLVGPRKLILLFLKQTQTKPKNSTSSIPPVHLYLYHV